VTPHVEPDRDIGLQGHYAGVVTRLTAFAFDVVTVLLLFSLGGAVVEYILSAVLGHSVRLSDAPVLAYVLLGVWAFVYCAYPLAESGRTFGMAVVGLRVVRADGHPYDARHAILRVVAFPLSFVFFCLGFLPLLVRRDRRALHDLIANSAVVYAWDARAARLRFLAKRQDEPSAA
jgi:uncharacterized RDD family membrane protein YckC